ncbi:hypothetical protein [Candidatus Phytoplasma rubi]|uniref:hypothetical protein n=1 Tax=Candidatus Phytoplasma rubi TaxID=399025 RepID=UPI002285775D|nr:hypothetical protein [Candidatus Phytoplasma rubi]
MFIKKIFQFLPINLIFFIITLLSFIYLITIYYVIKFYFFYRQTKYSPIKIRNSGSILSTFNHELTQSSCGISLILG